MTAEFVEERLENDEFRELIPYLQLEDIFLIQIKYAEWERMFECVTEDNIEHLRCNLCVDKPVLKFKEFEAHIKEESHKDALKCVDKFYHPVYTYAKDKESSGQQESDSVSKTKEISDEAHTYEAKRLASLVSNLCKQNVIRLSMDEIMNIICLSEKRFALLSHGRKDLLRCVLCNKIVKDLDKHFREENHIKKLHNLKSLMLENHPELNKYSIIQTDMNSKDVQKYERILKEIVLKEKPKAPHMVQIVCEMVINDLLLIEYLNKNNKKYRPMLTKIDGSPSLIKCLLCGKTLSIPSVHSHLLGKQHKKIQLELKDLRHKTNDQVTKYWSFSLGQEYNFQVTLKARKKHKSAVLSELQRLNKLHSKEATDVSEDCEMTSSEVHQNENEESRNEEQTGEVHEEIVDITDEADAVQPPQLSAKVAAKVKALQAANSNKIKANDQTINDVKKSKETESIPIPNIAPEDALIGVEYVVKILKNPNAKSQLYECCLCEVLMNERHMQAHLTGYNHRYKYCELHYSDALKKYLGCLSDRKCKDVALVMGPILEKMAYEIEKYHGRCVPRGVPAEEFKNKRPEVIAKLYCSKHATQLYGPSYTNIISQEEMNSLIDNKHLINNDKKTPKNDTNRFITFTNGQIYCKQKIRADSLVNFIAECPPLRDRSLQIRRRSRSRSLNRIKRDSASKIHERSSRIARERLSPGFNEHKQSIWQKYRQQILISASEVEYAYIEYRKNPESHPLYDQEWKRFWKQRKDELTAQGIDHRSYNFQPDWVPFFRNRIEQLFGEALQQAKLDVRRRLNIPLDAEEDCESGANVSDYDRNFILRNQAHGERPTNAGPRMQVNQTALVRYIPPEPVPKKQRFDAENLVNQWNAQTTSQDRSYEHKQDERNSVHKYADRKPDVIHVLRMMAAFEDYLGSLGPKITDLLFMTLSLDKTLPKDSLLLEQKVLTTNNYSLLETAMEKLKGILYAGLLDNSKQPGFNQVIQCTENLLNYADKMGYRHNTTVSQENLESTHMITQSTSDTNLQELFNFIANQKSINSNSIENKQFSLDSRNITYPSHGNQYNSQDINTNSNFNPKQQNFTNTLSHFNQEQRHERNIVNRNNSNISQTNFNRETQRRFNSNNQRISGGNSAISAEMVGRNSRMQGPGQSSDNINMASVVGRNNHDNSNLNNNYPKNNYPNSINNGMFQGGGFSGNWNRNSGNSAQQPNTVKRDWKQTNTMGGNMTALQLQNLKQLQFLRQQQQQRLNQQK